MSDASTIYTGADADEVNGLIREHHYSARMPSNIQHIYAARDSGGLLGDTGTVRAAAIFSIPPTRWAEPVLELSRLVRDPEWNVNLSQLLAFSARHIKASGHHLLVSFADWTQGHHGGIYQASGWKYHGQRTPAMDGVLIDGAFVPGRSCNSRYGTRSPEKLKAMLPSCNVETHFDAGKHLYWRHLTVAGKTRAKRLCLKSNPYPKPAACPLDEREPSRASSVQPRNAAPSFPVRQVQEPLL